MAYEFKLEDPGEGIHEVEIRDLLVSEGDSVEEGEEVMVVESDKAAVELPAPVSGDVEEIRVAEGDMAKVGDVLMTIATSEARTAKRPEKSGGAESERPTTRARSERRPETRTSRSGKGGKVKATPAARGAAKEHGLDLSEISGTGSEGHITKRDVEQAAGEGRPSRRDEEERVERQPLRSIRRATAKRMARAWAEIPHVTHHDEADVSMLEEARQTLLATLGEEAPKLTLTAFVLKALGLALQRHASFNASIDMEAQEILLKRHYDIALALDSERGLLTPVIRGVDEKSVLELAEEAEDLGRRVRGGNAHKSDLEGGTFTLTNIGGMGGTSFSPIINPPQVAILGLGRASLKQVLTGDRHAPEAHIRLMLPMALAFDHRVVDGADAARFVNDLKALLEDPVRFLCELR